MKNGRAPAYNVSINQALKNGGFYGSNGVWNSLVKIDGKVLRGRVETLVIKKEQQQLFMHIKNYNKKKYRIPGGSYEKGVPNYIQAQNEVNEEARIKVKNIINTGRHYMKIYDSPPQWMHGIPSSLRWVGNYIEVYVGEYDGPYTGHIREEDKDEDMYKHGKFYNLSEVYPILNDTHRAIIDDIFPEIKKGEIDESMIVLGESDNNVHYYPYYTPAEMSKLGVFNEKTNRYASLDDEAIDWYHEYTDSLRNPDSANWYKELQIRYDEMIKDNTAENKQAVLNLGWNPEVAVTMENVLIASKRTKVRLNQAPKKSTLIDEGLIFSEKDVVLNIDDFESGKSNILFITGLAGSGKTTLAETLEKQYGAETISLDYFQHETTFYYGGFNEFKDTESYRIVEKYMKEHPEIEKSRHEFSNISLDDFSDFFLPFFGWLINELKGRKPKKYIVEGVHILLFVKYKDIKDYPLYCVNTSAIKSIVRHWRRDEWTLKEIIKHGYKDILRFKNWNDSYNRFKKSMNENVVQEQYSVVNEFTKDYIDTNTNQDSISEATTYDPISGGEVKSPFTIQDFILTAKHIQSSIDKQHENGLLKSVVNRDIESDDGGFVFAQYKIDDMKEAAEIVEFINEMNARINSSVLVGQIEIPKFSVGHGILSLKDVDKFLGEGTLLNETNITKFYRVTYNGVGIYEAVKQRTSQEEWKLLLSDPHFTWLPKPPKYTDGYVSYFTEYGYKMFEMNTYPLIEKYFDEDILVIPLITLSDEIIYEDKYQIVVNTKLYESGIYNNDEYLEEGEADEMNYLFELYDHLVNNTYGIVINRKVITDISSINFSKQYKTLSVNDFEKYHAGVCWDFAKYQEWKLKKKYRNVQNYYIALDFAPNYPTHTITVVQIGKKFYYIEVSWGKYKGIYEADSVNDILNLVAKRLIEHENAPSNVRCECRAYTDNNKLVGMNPVEYMAWMDKQKNITIHPDKADESKLIRVDTVNESSSNDDKEYGLPDLKKYPMPDEKHVLSAIRFFNYVSPANEAELARNIKKKMKQYNISPSRVGDKNRLKKYLAEDSDIIEELCFNDFANTKPVLVFDLGSVLVYSGMKMIDSLYKNKLIPDEYVEDIDGIISTSYRENNRYLEYCTRAEYIKFIQDRTPEGMKKYIPIAMDVDTNTIKKYKYTDALLKQLKDKGYKIYYLSNWSGWSRDGLVKNGTFDFLKYFDGGIFSCDVGCMKPDHKIYNELFSKYQLDPKTTVFFDDRHDNVKAATEVGMYGILFDSDYTPQWIIDTFTSGTLY